ncbi:MAG: hypothetical protein BWX79_01305 [Alphaproteobacteria bacterium ADurb.Bin100]|jgi:hypothetical protein|nr:MAG: hypothetical protein BWX79_01305 [Alphaproteobacteria bacterium ADurb.Bin100]
MPVTNSTKVTSDIGGGRYYVVERHFDQDGKEVGFFTWSSVPEQDIDAVVAARVVEIDERLANDEFEAIIGAE